MGDIRLQQLKAVSTYVAGPSIVACRSLSANRRACGEGGLSTDHGRARTACMGQARIAQRTNDDFHVLVSIGGRQFHTGVRPGSFIPDECRAEN